MTPPSNPSKAELRKRLLEMRSALHPHQRSRIDRQICAHLLRMLNERDDVDIAGFLPFRGEPDLTPALSALADAGRRIWLPVVADTDMRFHRWRPGAKLSPNRFGIPEPLDGPHCEIARLELVLTPLVAYSRNGARLGMGAGYYDRAFAFTRRHPDAGPWLMGVAYTLQQVDGLPTDPWDVPLDAVLTERGVAIFRE